jgi:hypothetical protein
MDSVAMSLGKAPTADPDPPEPAGIFRR